MRLCYESIWQLVEQREHGRISVMTTRWRGRSTGISEGNPKSMIESCFSVKNIKTVRFLGKREERLMSSCKESKGLEMCKTLGPQLGCAPKPTEYDHRKSLIDGNI